MTARDAQPEFSRICQIDELEDDPVSRDMSANENERAGLALRYGVAELHSVRAELSVSGAGQRRIRVDGGVSAKLVQNCVVTLEPVDEVVRAEVAVTFLPESEEALQEADLAAFDDDDVEVFDGESVDLGELVAQTVAAAIDPYPRKEGAEFGKAPGLGDNEGSVRENPFAVLKGLKPAGGNAEEG